MLPLRARIAIVSLSLFAVVACTIPTSPVAPPPSPAPSPPPPPPSGGDAQISGSPEATFGARLAAEKVNEFGASLYSQLRGESGNLICSPYSIHCALGLAAEGAQGTTADELDDVAHFNLRTKVNSQQAYRDLAVCIATAPRETKHKPELSIANSLWIQQGHPWKKDYLSSVRENYRAGLFEADFARDPEGERGRINKWVEKETRDRIKDLLPEKSLTVESKIVLANAIYFKARWADEFKKEDTKPEDFTLAGGRKIKAPLMYRRGAFWLREEDGMQTLRLPYDGGATSMYVILPRAHDGLPAVEQKLTGENLAKWTNGQDAGDDVKVWMPRFKFTVPTELADVLKKMGVREAFSPKLANFKGMTDDPRGLFITRVIHKAFVETDELGTEAAAATAIIAAPGAAPGFQPPPPRVKEFRADHPFLFVIKHEPTGAILFLSRVDDPTK